MNNADPITTALDWLTEQVADADPQPTVCGFGTTRLVLTWYDAMRMEHEISCCHDDPHKAARKVLEMYRLITHGPEVVAAARELLLLIEGHHAPKRWGAEIGLLRYHLTPFEEPTDA